MRLAKLAVEMRFAKLAVLTTPPPTLPPPGEYPTIVEAYKIPTLRLFITELGKKRYPLPVPKVRLLVVSDEVVKFRPIPTIVDPS
jgi:hypothetical protein